MAGRNFLFVPGPTNVPDRILRAMSVASEDHRSPDFPALTRACLDGLKPIFKTVTGNPIIFPSSGTGCWEAALTNCLDQGAKVLIARFGQFSHLWADMCRRLGFEVELIETAWGEGAPVDKYLAALEADRKPPHQGGAGVPERNGHRRDSDVARHPRRAGQRQTSRLLLVDSVSR